VPRRSERGRRGLARRPRPHRSEFPVGYSSAGCSPAGPPAASTAVRPPRSGGRGWFRPRSAGDYGHRRRRPAAEGDEAAFELFAAETIINIIGLCPTGPRFDDVSIKLVVNYPISGSW
jgi:hypothetical protein